MTPKTTPKTTPNHPRPRTNLLAAVSMAALLSSVFLAGCKKPVPKTEATAPPPAHPLIVKKHIYSDTADATADIAAALHQAKAGNKRVIVDFGGDWCGDCQVLDINFHKPPNADIVDQNFLIVHVNIGRFDKNLDVAKKYDVPIDKGVPALAVLDSTGKLLYSQKTGEFEDMRNMNPQSVTDFLNRWKA